MTDDDATTPIPREHDATIIAPEDDGTVRLPDTPDDDVGVARAADETVAMLSDDAAT